jgi:hypothetical protein
LPRCPFLFSKAFLSIVDRSGRDSRHITLYPSWRISARFNDLSLQRFSKFIRFTACCSEQMTYGQTNCPTLVQIPLFGAGRATIVQPEGYNGLKYTDVFAHHDVSPPPSRNASSRSRIGSRVICASELKKYRIHHQILRRALDRGTVIKVHRGIYASKDFPSTLDQRIILACVL